MMVRADRTLRTAFTLIEVLAVVVIIGLAGAVVVPSLMRPGTLGVQAAGRMVISDILIAQNEAIALQTTRQVIFEPALNRYRVADAGGNTINAPWKAGGVAVNYIIDFDTDARFAGVTLQLPTFTGVDPQVLEFDVLGAPQNGGTVDLVAAGFRYRVSVAPFTGRVTIAPIIAAPPPPPPPGP